MDSKSQLSDAVVSVADWMRAQGIEIPADLAAQIETIKIKAVRFIPDGANEPMIPIPAEVEISDNEIDQAVALWDELMPDFAGLLDAEVINKRGAQDGFPVAV